MVLGELLLAFAATVIIGSGPHGIHDRIFLSPNWLSRETHSAPNSNIRSDHIGNTVSKSSFVVSIFVAAGTWLLSRCLAMDVSAVVLRLHLFQLPDMSQYNQEEMIEVVGGSEIRLLELVRLGDFFLWVSYGLTSIDFLLYG
jgi:hypothetical protein